MRGGFLCWIAAIIAYQGLANVNGKDNSKGEEARGIARTAATLKRALNIVWVNDGMFIPDVERQGSDNRLLSVLSRLREMNQSVTMHDSHCDMVYSMTSRQRAIFEGLAVPFVCTSADNRTRWLQELRFDVAFIPMWPHSRR